MKIGFTQLLTLSLFFLTIFTLVIGVVAIYSSQILQAFAVATAVVPLGLLQHFKPEWLRNWHDKIHRTRQIWLTSNESGLRDGSEVKTEPL